MSARTHKHHTNKLVGRRLTALITLPITGWKLPSTSTISHAGRAGFEPTPTVLETDVLPIKLTPL